MDVTDQVYEEPLTLSVFYMLVVIRDEKDLTRGWFNTISARQKLENDKRETAEDFWQFKVAKDFKDPFIGRHFNFPIHIWQRANVLFCS